LEKAGHEERENYGTRGKWALGRDSSAKEELVVIMRARIHHLRYDNCNYNVFDLMLFDT